MSKGYVFLSNSTKPTDEQNNSRKHITLTNVSRPCLKAALDMGYEVFLGENRNDPEGLEIELPVHVYDSHTYRSITAFRDNRVAYKNLSKVLNENDIQVIHCNTPVGGLIGRLCGRRYHVKYIIYTAHGFHFYKGAPLINRTVYKWAEMIMAHWTNAIITMNQEDYESAKKMRLRKGGKVYKVHGVGITLSDYENLNVNRIEKREGLGLSGEDIICISAGDIVPRKNYGVAIEAIARAKNPNLHYLICGVGPEEERLRKRVKELGINNQIHFLGFRTDVKELLMISDIFLFSSLQEGLPRSLMEAMACGLPCIASKIRGNVDLLKNEKGGYLCDADDIDAYVNALDNMSNNTEIRNRMGMFNLEEIKKYDVSVVQREIEQIYREVLL